MIEIRKLTLNDWALVEGKLKSANNFYIAQTKERIGLDNYLEYTAKSFTNSEDTVYGYFVDNDLISITTVYNYKIMPAYLLKK
jgi:hypothetical protein